MPKTENGISSLTPKQHRFVDEYLIDLNGAQAAIRAGYSAGTARSVAAENLTKPYIWQAIQVAMEERSQRVQVSQDDVLREIQILMQSDVRDYRVNADTGDLELREGAPETAWRAVSSIKRRRIVTGPVEDPTIVHEIELRLWDKPAVIKLAAQHKAMLVNKVEHSGGITLQDILSESRSPDLDAILAHRNGSRT